MRGEDSEILLALYRSAQDIPAWGGFLAALAARTGAQTAQLIVQTEGQGPQVFGADPPLLPDDLRARMRYLRPYSGDDFTQARPFRALRTRVDGGGDAWVIVARDGDDFAAATSVLLGTIAPHIALAAAQFWQREKQRLRQAAAQDMGARLGFGWAVLGADAQPILASETLPSPFVSGGRLRLPADPLRKITQRVEGYVTGQATRPMALNLPNLQALLVPFSGYGAAAILYMQTAKLPPETAPEILQDMLNLTPAEARFAAQLAQGKSITQAGDAVNYTLETARYYSKQIYAKLGAAGQAEAVWHLQNSVYRLL